MMSDKEICVTCLVIDVRMIRISQQLRNMYLEITGLQATECPSIPCYVCYLCHAQIQKLHKFKKKCLASQKILKVLHSSKRKITKTAMKAIDRKAHGLESDLSYIHDIKSSVMSFQSFVYSYDNDKMNDDPFPRKTFQIQNEKVGLCLFKPTISEEGVKNENERTNKDQPKESNAIFENNVQDMSFKIDEDDEVVSVEEESQVACMQCVTDESDDVERNYPDNEIKSIKASKHFKTKKVKKLRCTPEAKKKDAEAATFRKLWFVQSMTPEDQKIQLLSRQLSAAYTSKKYKCELCYTGFNSETGYKHHKNRHEYGVFGTLCCDLCKKYTRTKQNMSEHMQRYHFSKYNCKTCGHISYSRSAASHHSSKHEKMSYKCPSCDKEFRTVQTLSLHKNNHHATEPCDVCGLCFVTKHGLMFHKKSKHGVKGAPTLEVNREHPLYCKVCQTVFADLNAYVLHIVKSSKHCNEEALQYATEKEVSKRCRLKPKPTTCHVCKLVLKSNQAAIKHYRQEHPGTKMPGDHICRFCGKSFTAQAIHAHENTHTRAKLFDCPECPKTFSRSSNRTRHIQRAHKDRHLTCNFCDYRTSQKFELKIHIQEIHMHIPYLPKIMAEKRRNQKKRMNKLK